MITPLDIRKLEFNKKIRGYDENEVRTTLDSIAKDLENQIRENTHLNEKLKIAEERLNHFKLLEKTLQDSVLTMQTTLEEKRKGAEQEAELIIQEAKQRANEELKDYHDRAQKLRTEIHALEGQKASYFLRFKNFLLGQLEWIETMEKEDNLIQKSQPSTMVFRKKAARKITTTVPTVKKIEQSENNS